MEIGQDIEVMGVPSIGVSNVLSDEKRQQVIALGRLARLGWPLQRIQQETGIRREIVGVYLKAAGVSIRAPGAARSLSALADNVRVPHGQRQRDRD